VTHAKRLAHPAPDGALDDESLDSPRLREVLIHYSSVRRPAHVVAASATFRADKIVTAKMATALDTLKLTPDRYEILGLLTHTPGGRSSLKELGQAVLSHPATTTYTVDILEKRGLIKRRPDPKDRRGVLAQVTPAGRDLVRRATKMLELIDWGMGELSDEDAATVARVLSRLHPA
jgi:DNA-binding MarR family transcriptional regulator